MNRIPDPLRTLINTARKARQPIVPKPGPEAPFGFAARVAARWVRAGEGAGRPGRASHWERLCWWGASVSVAVCVTAFAHRMLAPELNALDLVLEAQTVDLEFP